ncbi:MAG TPA: hypothetical protein VIF57_01950, partial [Polyangia bacterium]
MSSGDFAVSALVVSSDLAAQPAAIAAHNTPRMPHRLSMRANLPTSSLFSSLVMIPTPLRDTPTERLLDSEPFRSRDLATRDWSHGQLSGERRFGRIGPGPMTNSRCPRKSCQFVRDYSEMAGPWIEEIETLMDPHRRP